MATPAVSNRIEKHYCSCLRGDHSGNKVEDGALDGKRRTSQRKTEKKTRRSISDLGANVRKNGVVWTQAHSLLAMANGGKGTS